MRQDAEIFFGTIGLKSAHKKLVEDGDKKKELVFFYRPDQSTVQKVHKFFAKLDIEDVYRHIPMRGLFSTEYEKFFRKSMAEYGFIYWNCLSM